MVMSLTISGCIYSNKDKNFKANHNILCLMVVLLVLYL